MADGSVGQPKRVRAPSRTFRTRTLHFVSTNGAAIVHWANILGVSPTAIAGNFAEEFNNDLTSPYGGWQGTGINVSTSVRLSWATHQGILDDYNAIMEMIAANNIPGADDPRRRDLKLENLAFMDIGPANIQVATAITALRDYLRRSDTHRLMKE